jgi:hypothetical protein
MAIFCRLFHGLKLLLVLVVISIRTNSSRTKSVQYFIEGIEAEEDYDDISPDISFGKDRELLHASIDLKWLFNKIIDINEWKKAGVSAFINVRKRLSKDFNEMINYRESAATFLWDLRSTNPHANLRYLYLFFSHFGVLVLHFASFLHFDQAFTLSVYIFLRLLWIGYSIGHYETQLRLHL